MEIDLSRIDKIMENLERIEKEERQMLQDWASHIALWLIEDPLFFKNRETKIVSCILRAPKWHPIFQDAFDSRRIALLDAIEEASNAPEHLKKDVGRVKILLEMANRELENMCVISSPYPYWRFSLDRAKPIVQYEITRIISLK